MALVTDSVSWLVEDVMQSCSVVKLPLRILPSSKYYTLLAYITHTFSECQKRLDVLIWNKLRAIKYYGYSDDLLLKLEKGLGKHG